MKNLNSTLKFVKCLVVILITFITFSNSFSQYQERSYNLKCGVVSANDYGRSIINRIDNGYAIAGYSYASGCGIGIYDWMFLKIKPSGNHETVRLLGTVADDRCYSLIQSTDDTGYVLAGNMYDLAKSRNRATMVKLDMSGNFQYEKMIYDSLNSQYMQVVNDPSNTRGFTGWDNRIVGSGAAAVRTNKILATQYNSAGNMNWGYRYDSWSSATSISKSTEEAYSICFQQSGGCYGVTARTNFYSGVTGKWDILVVKLSYTGAVIWKKVYRLNFPSPNFYPSAEPRKIIPMSDGGFVIVGSTNAYSQTGSDIIVFRINSTGGLMWSNTYGSTSYLEYGNSIVLDGNYLVVTGERKTAATSPNALLMKIPAAGGPVVWTRIWDATTTDAESGYDLVKSTISAPDGYAVTGETYRGTNLFDPFLWRTNINGVIPVVHCEDSTVLSYYTNPHKLDSFLLQRISVPDKSFTPAVSIPQVVTNTICLPVTDNPTGIQEDNINEEIEFDLNQNYPNPFNPVTNIKFNIPVESFVTLKVFDIAGKEVFELVNERKAKGRYEVKFDGSNISSGIYYYKIKAGDFNDIKKMILIK